jgi:PRTRC genetic system protein B
MEISVAIGGGQDMTLSGAVLVYQGGREAFAVWHPAKSGPTEGAPYLGEAEPLTMEFLRALSTGLGVYVAPEVLPASVLVRTSELLVWWTPAQRRILFFGEHSGAGSDLNGKQYPVPPLVFKVAGGKLSVRALDKDGRPRGETKLKTAPFWNCNDAGEVCVGTMRLPESSGVEAIEGWEYGFFQSEFTHAYGAARLTSFPGGFLPLCRRLAGSRKPFPKEYLTDARETLRQFVERR